MIEPLAPSARPHLTFFFPAYNEEENVERTVQLALEQVGPMVDSLEVPEAAPRQQRRLSELRGLGKEIWEGIDAQEYIDQLRSAWDERP